MKIALNHDENQIKVHDGKLVDKTKEHNFIDYMRNPRLILSLMFPLLPIIHEIYDP